MMEQAFGLFKGIVTSVSDPEGRNRIQALVPQVFGDSVTVSDWALPCFQPATMALPAPGQGVWIAFENGEPDYPVWLGQWQTTPASIAWIGIMDTLGYANSWNDKVDSGDTPQQGGSGQQIGQYRLVGDIVQVRGVIYQAAAATPLFPPLTIFTLPLGYQPQVHQPSFVQDSDGSYAVLDVFADGAVQLTSGSGGFYFLNMKFEFSTN
jgi:hypothetical protein